MLTATAPEASSWEIYPPHDKELAELEFAMRENRKRLQRLRLKYPCVWHLDYGLGDYTKWIAAITREPDPSLHELTIVCLAVRAATDSAEFEWRTRPESEEIDDQIRALILAVGQAVHYIAGRRGLSAEDEQARSLYEQHARTNLAILEALVNKSEKREERGKLAFEKRKGEMVL